MTEKTYFAWYRIAFKREVHGLPSLDLSRLAQDDKRRIWYIIGQVKGKISKGA